MTASGPRAGSNPEINFLADKDRAAAGISVAINTRAEPQLSVEPDRPVDQAATVSRTLSIAFYDRQSMSSRICPRQNGKYRRTLYHCRASPPHPARKLWEKRAVASEDCISRHSPQRRCNLYKSVARCSTTDVDEQ